MKMKNLLVYSAWLGAAFVAYLVSRAACSGPCEFAPLTLSSIVGNAAGIFAGLVMLVLVFVPLCEGIEWLVQLPRRRRWKKAAPPK